MSSGLNIGAMPPPPGVKANFVNPDSITGRLILAATIWPAVTLPIILLRLYTSRFILREVFAVANSAISGIQTRNGAGYHLWDVPVTDFKRFMKLGSIGGMLTYNFCTMFIKLSILSLHQRFSTSLPGGSCLDADKPFVSGGGLNVGTDILILLFPIWMLWPLRMPLLQKIGVVLIMMLGGLVCIVSLLRFNAALHTDGNMDFTWKYLPNLVWILCEMYTGIICACLPCFRSFTKHFFPHLIIFRDDFEERLTSRHPFLGGLANEKVSAVVNEGREGSVEVGREHAQMKRTWLDCHIKNI
ncbi:hypothetical protein B0H63DRAFT_565033 [Podospora didyma]|uniref:Rhodopsin domain-containing protein n=1 Tax=Podospora didyma TaxID=330526 RepID=A0AAE0K2E1_9PEZI|nr:hypothetical protein B0H63DRAFT_565033 [Podospora didyma]